MNPVNRCCCQMVIALLLLGSCTKLDTDIPLLPGSDPASFTAHQPGHAATDKVTQHISRQLLTDDYSHRFVQRYGRPLWDAALLVPGADTNRFVLLVPVRQGETITAFIAAGYAHQRLYCELHRRDMPQVSSYMGITNGRKAALLHYFTGTVLHRMDTVAGDWRTLQREENIQPDRLVTICWKVKTRVPCAQRPGVGGRTEIVHACYEDVRHCTTL